MTTHQDKGRCWGFPREVVQNLGSRLHAFWERYRGCFKTTTREGSEYAYHYLSGLLRMEAHRNFTGIGRIADVEGQTLQHFMSQSPWSGAAVCAQVREELKATPDLTSGGVLVVDESGDEKAGDQSAGAAKQYNGRLGKIETSQMGVMLAYVNLKVLQGFWTWISGKLFLPTAWFDDDHSARRQRLGIPTSLNFKTKIELAWELIKEAIEQNIPFEIICCDAFYGRSGTFRAQIRKAGRLYMAEIPEDTLVYLERPTLGVPERTSRKGPAPSRVRVLTGEAVPVSTLGASEEWVRLRIRATERGDLYDRFLVRRVWTLYEETPVEEWLVIREIREASDGTCSYALCNAPADTALEQLAWWKCQRYFIERSNQDAKSGLGWDEFQAQKYLAWDHHIALTILASWFLAQTKYEWAQEHPRDPDLMSQLKTDMLPALSMANIRELLRSVMPLPRLTEEQAIERVIEHLSNRTRSRKSRLKKQQLIQSEQFSSA